MSHKYYGFKKNENNFFTIPFLAAKSQRLRFLNNELVVYGQKNEFIIHKNPGLTILRLDDKYINHGLHNHANTNKIMTEFLNQLVSSSNSRVLNLTKDYQNKLKIKAVAIVAKSNIQIKLNNYNNY